MLKARRLLGRTLVIAALLWCGLWLAGRVMLSDRLEGGLAALAEAGVAVDHDGQSISGFPFGYEARLSDVAVADATGGAALRLPELTGAVHVTAPGAVVARFPDRFEAEIPRADGVARRVRIESRGLELAARGLAGADRRAELAAERVVLTEAGGVSLALSGLSATATGPALAAGATPSGRAEARDLRLDLTLAVPEGGTLGISARLENARLSGETDLVEEGALARMLGGRSRRPGRAELALDGERLVLTLAAEGTGPRSDGRIAITAGPVGVTLTVEDGRLDARAELGTTRIGLDLPGHGIDGALASRAVAGRYAMPLGPGEGFDPAALHLEIAEAAPDASLWSDIDPDGRLPRGPLALLIDVAGTARLSKPFADTRPGEMPPVVPGTVSVNAVRLSGLGAGARAEGSVAFTAGQAPTGEIAVELDGAVSLLRRLHEAGLIDRERLQRLALGLAGFTRAGAEPGRLETRIDFDQGRMRINGERLR